MPCPHFSIREIECLLLDQQPGADEEEDTQAGEGERIRLDYCLSSTGKHRACPIFRRHLVEQTRGF